MVVTLAEMQGLNYWAMWYARLCSVLSNIRAWISISDIGPVASSPKFPFHFIKQTCHFLFIFLNNFFNGHATKWDLWSLAASFSWVPIASMSLLSLSMPIAKQSPLAWAWEKASSGIWFQLVLGQHPSACANSVQPRLYPVSFCSTFMAQGRGEWGLNTFL